MNCAKLCSSGMPLVRRDAVKVFLSNSWSPARSTWCHFSKRNRENKYPVCGPIRVRIGTDEPHPSEAKNLAQRLEEIRLAQSPQRRVDIGLPESAAAVVSRQERVALEGEKRKSAAAPSEEFDALSSETKAHLLKEWMRSSGASQLKELGDHYGIFRDLFGDEYFFYPRIHWRVQYSQPDHESPDCEVVQPVYFGNYLKPSEASEAPEITIETTDPESLWCVLMTGPDGHFTQEKSEYVHYLVGNIKGSEASTGEVVASYLQPFPAKGTGFQRYVFLLFKQDGVIDFSQWKKKDGSYDLSERTFSTLDFYAELQDNMTPASFSFFQATYDRSLRKFFQEKLEMREPVYEYDFPPPNYRPQVKYPISYSFNEYLDRYKHPQQINKEVLLLRLKDLHPFEGEPKPLKYPLAHKTPWNMPSWLKQDLADRALKEGKYKDL